MNELFSQGGKGSTGILTNKQAIARKFGVKQNEVVYFAAGVDLGGYKVIYDKATQRAYSLPILPVGTTAVSLSVQAVLIHSAGTVDLGELAATRREFICLSDSFATGLVVNTRNEILMHNGIGYTYLGNLPVTITSATNPVGNSDWKPQTDPSLSDRVASIEDDLSVISDKTLDWVTPDQFKLPGAVDDTAAFVAALAASKRIKLIARTYYVNADTIVTSSDDVYIIGEGSAHTKIVANSAGSVLINLGGAPGNPMSVRQRISVQGVTLDGAGLVTNTFKTSASQSPRLCDDVVVTGAVSHGFVHTRGWSTFARGLVCTNNGEQGLRLEGDNNNTHWEGMWSHNGTIGIYVQNAAAVSFTGSIENNGEEGAVVDATSTIPSGFVNTVSSAVLFTDACYFESNGKKAPGTYAEVRFGGNGGGTVRDCSVQAAHIGIPASGIGIQINGSASRITVDSTGLYPVAAPMAYIRFSGAYTSLASVFNADCKFINIKVPASGIVSAGFTDTDGLLAAYVLSGGSLTIAGINNALHTVKLTDANNTGTYLERIYRGNEIISERGVKPNVQVWNNAGSSAGYHSYAIAGTEVMRMNASNFQPRTDNTINLGAASTRWGTIYSGTSTINTSDERLKATQVTDDTTAANEALAATAIKKCIYRFKFQDSINEKGEADARIHFGVGAQTVKSILEQYNLVPADYAFWCYDEWEDELDDAGNIVIPAGNRYGIRYSELIMFILKYM